MIRIFQSLFQELIVKKNVSLMYGTSGPVFKWVKISKEISMNSMEEVFGSLLLSTKKKG